MGFRNTSQDFPWAAAQACVGLHGKERRGRSLLWRWGLCAGCQGVRRSTAATEEGFVPALLSHRQVTNWRYWRADITNFCLDGDWGVIPLVSRQRIFCAGRGAGSKAAWKLFSQVTVVFEMEQAPTAPCLMLPLLSGKAHEPVFCSRVHPVLHVRLLPVDISN